MVSSQQRNFSPLAIYEMMGRLGIDAAGAVIPRYGLAFASAMRTCRGCNHAQRCRKWLRGASPALSLAPRFCPNADLLLQLKLDGPTARPASTAQATPPMH